MYRYIAVEGVVAAGKSTFLSALATHQSAKPNNIFNVFRNLYFKSHNRITLLYKNPFREAVTVHMYIVKVIRQYYISESKFTALTRVIIIGPKFIIVSERSPESGFVFLQTQYNFVYLTKFAYDLIHEEYVHICR